ncbi:MAG: class I SAM-dependent methyltransferase [Jatrophihabitans sp.]|uniref:class I SAM-dependent methyltransferase n=1 Tax=Jatrophihabitans sp. TaxID=1932789 RepID=UPI003F7E7ECB
MIRQVPDERRRMIGAIEASARDGRVRLLEAGCGNRWGLKPEGLDLSITGVDLDAEAMKLRQQQHGDIDEMIVADLRDVDLPQGEFDVVYCSYVLEHVEGAELVLDRMVAALRPGGRLILRVPDRDSVFGFVARHTPHRTHIWFKKYVERFPDAGKPGHAPYPVVYERVVSERGLRAWAADRGLVVEQLYATYYFIDKFGRLAPLVDAGLRLVAALSRGRLTARWNNLGLIVRKP